MTYSLIFSDQRGGALSPSSGGLSSAQELNIYPNLTRGV